MEWSLGVEQWSGVLEWILKWNEVRFGVILPFLDRIWLCLTSSLSMLTFTVNLALDSLCLFCHVSLTCFNQALNICFIIGRQM